MIPAMPWEQNYTPFTSPLLSALLACLPLLVLLGSLAILRLKAHWAALLGLISALLVAVLALRMPFTPAIAASLYGAAYGFLPVGWIILNVIFLFRLAQQRGIIERLRSLLENLTADRRLQLLVVAFGIGSFFEGAAGFGAPVAITATLLMGLGFSPLLSSGLSLIANTAPVAYGGLGTPVVALAGVTGLDLLTLSGLIARELAIFAVIVPFWVTITFGGVKALRGIALPLLLSGISFAIVKVIVASLHGPWLVDVAAALISLALVLWLLRKWQPNNIYRFPNDPPPPPRIAGGLSLQRSDWLPWLILAVVVFLWGMPQVRQLLDSFTLVSIPVPGLHEQVLRMPPVRAAATPEPAVFQFNWLSTTGTGILIAAILGGLSMGYQPKKMLTIYTETLKEVRFSLLTISLMMAVGFVLRYAGLDAILGLAFARAGILYPFFGTLLGWVGVALTGSDTSSNVLFGSMQMITAGQVGVSPLLMASANTAGGVMGKMIAAQSIVVASTATRWYGHEGEILRYVFWHSLALALLAGGLIMLMAYVAPFTLLI